MRVVRERAERRVVSEKAQAREADLICVTGSVAFVGEAMRVLGLEA